MHSLDLVILAGGKGSRIKSLLKGKPKPMATFNNKPFLEYIIQSYSKSTILCFDPSTVLYLARTCLYTLTWALCFSNHGREPPE